jgi:hypothetical protein
MKIMVEWYKPSGKWYTEGEVEIGDVRLWHGFDEMLEAIWANQTILMDKDPESRKYWTIVSRDLPGNEKNPEYHEFTQAILQVGRSD